MDEQARTMLRVRTGTHDVQDDARRRRPRKN
ncbi:unnamed protein product [Oikopleura dioica]|uniref:Uncharacterized protein n=1 Tax=Oikopleura dioica TaxID=34765 RepID=E4XXY4_OIKDI|nr:unnamed protein product [Oikopleura dioica]